MKLNCKLAVIHFMKNHGTFYQSKKTKRGFSLKFTKIAFVSFIAIGLGVATPSFAAETNDQVAELKTTIETSKKTIIDLQKDINETNRQLQTLQTKKAPVVEEIKKQSEELRQLADSTKKNISDEKAELRVALAKNEAIVTEQETQAKAILTAQKALITKESTLWEAITKDQKKIKELEAAAQKEEQQSAEFAAPLAGELVVTSGFGYREDPTGASGNQHDGIDFAGSYGQTVLATRGGTVEQAGFDPSAGNYVIIRHDNGYYSYYMHLSEMQLATGQTVTQGATVGLMGSTGNSTGVHLHFGVSTQVWSGFVDPATLLAL